MHIPEKITGHTEEQKRHRKTGLYSVLTAMIGTTVVWFAASLPIWDRVMKPMIIDAVAAEAATELDTKVKESVKEEVQPLKAKVDAGNEGLKAIIQSTIFLLEEEIDKLEYIQRHTPNNFTPELRDSLFKKRRQLSTQRSALNNIRHAETQNNNSRDPTNYGGRGSR